MFYHRKNGHVRTCRSIIKIPDAFLFNVKQCRGNECKENRPNRLLPRRLCDNKSPSGRALHTSPYTSTASTHISSPRLQLEYYNISASWFTEFTNILMNVYFSVCVIQYVVCSMNRGQRFQFECLLMGQNVVSRFGILWSLSENDSQTFEVSPVLKVLKDRAVDYQIIYLPKKHCQSRLKNRA